MRNRRICLVTMAHISYNPRLVKAADALAAAGCDVRVVAVNVEDEKWQVDQSLMPEKKWKLEVVTARRTGAGRQRWLHAAFRQKACLRAAHYFPFAGCLMRASSRYAPELASLALREQADLFIAYKLQVLPVAARAARRWQAKIGFDIEDFHSGMRRFDAASTPEEKWAERVEAGYLPRCELLTAASPGVAQAVAHMCGGRRPVSVLNVCPLSERPPERPARAAGAPLRLCWFSQMIGPDRGLEDAVRALKLLQAGRVELHLRGRCDHAAHRYLDRIISEADVDRLAIAVHAPVAPDVLVSLTAQYDVGLALEVPISQNRIICMNDLCTNKVFTYLMAGLGLAASALKNGAGIFDGAGFCYPSGDAAALAAGLQRWLDNPDALQRAKDKAWELASTRYNWEFEQKIFLSEVERVLCGPQSTF